MKKNLFFLFALICSMSLFTACGDDEDNGWKEIPAEIPAENVSLDINGGTLEGASASLKIETAETAVLTLTNAVYGHTSIPVNVTLKKVAEGSYDFEGTANIDGATKAAAAADLGLTVKVKGNVTKEGKLTVEATTSGWGTIAGIYSGDSLKATYDGSENNKYPVTVTMISETKATLLFNKIPNVASDFTAEVTLTKDGEGYKLAGTVEKEAGYTIHIDGTIAKNVLTVNLTYSGYATLNSMYSGTKFVYTYNNVASSDDFAGNGTVKFTSATTMDLTLSECVPNIFNATAGSRTITIKNLKVQAGADSKSYTFTGSGSPEGFKASTINVEGSISETDKTLKVTAAQVITSDIVGKWNMSKENNIGKVFFDFQSASNKVSIPDELYKLIPANTNIPKEMNDATFTGIIKNLLGQYTTYLKSIEFKANGDITVVYTKVGETGKEYSIEDYMNYAINDKGRLVITPNLAKLIGMLMPMNKSSKAYEVYDPTYILMGDGIPLNYSVSGNSLQVTVDNGVFIGLAGLVEGLLPLFGVLIPDPALVEKINATFPPVKDFIVTSPVLEVGLYLNK